MHLPSVFAMTALLSTMSITHAMPLAARSNDGAEHPHLRRASTVSELQGRQLGGHKDFMEDLGANFEPGNTIKTLLSFAKRQVSTGASNLEDSNDEPVNEATESPDETEHATFTGTLGGGKPGSDGFETNNEPGQAITKNI